jgi:hypothetical protein
MSRINGALGFGLNTFNQTRFEKIEAETELLES